MKLPKFEKSLAKFPTLVAEWHPVRNEHRIPASTFAGSAKKVWWKCSQGHEWEATPGNRSILNTGCPYCSGRRTSLENSLTVTHPELCAEWHPTKNIGKFPEQFSKGNPQKIWWICARGHEWKSGISGRAIRGYGCRRCFLPSKIELRIFCELRSIFPDAEWQRVIEGIEIDVWIPSLRLAIEYDGAQWHKDVDRDKRKNHKIAALGIQCIRIREIPLPLLGVLDIQVNKDDAVGLILLRVLDLIALQRGTVNFDVSRWAQGDFLNDACYRSILSQIRLRGVPMGMSVADRHPRLLAEWHPKNHPITLAAFTEGSREKAWWVCSQGHEWSSRISHRVQGHGCPTCSGRQSSSTNNLALHYPQVARKWHPVFNAPCHPQDVLPKSGRKIWWMCPCGHTWQAIVAVVTKRSAKCPGCGLPIDG